MTADFVTALEAKIKNQTRSRMVGFLLGAGASYLNGAGYPLADQVWGKISSELPTNERQDIQAKLDSGATGLEHALDLLDSGVVSETQHRHSVVKALANHFYEIDAPLDRHRQFVKALERRAEQAQIRIFSLNYDPLVERAAEQECVRLFDGFQGHDHAFFDVGSFRHTLIIRGRDYRGRRSREIPGCIKLIKLHGSVGWYQSDETGVRRCKFDDPIPEHTNRLMIPPQYRKAQDTGRAPYSTLWSEFRASLFHGDDKLNRLISLGYGMADEHVNTEIENALERDNFTLIIIAKELSDPSFEKWSNKSRVHIVTENRCSLDCEVGPGHPGLSSFEGYVEELNQWYR